MRFAVAKQQGLIEDTVDEIADGFDASDALSERQKAALRFTDAFLDNEPGSIAHLTDESGFDAAQRFELALGLGLFHGFSKVLIVLGVEPEPGSMPTTELATPNTVSPAVSLRTGLAALEAQLDLALAPWPAWHSAARDRVRLLLLDEREPPAQDVPQLVADIAELFVVDSHAITDADVAAIAAAVGPAATVSLLVALAVADATARLERSGAAALIPA